MPAMFAIHERKLKVTHDEMKCPCMATDDETGFTAAIDDHLTNVRRLLCWNNSINAAKVWLRKHGATASKLPVYLSHLQELLHQKTCVCARACKKDEETMCRDHGTCSNPECTSFCCH